MILSRYQSSTALLAAGDLATIVAFAAMGTRSHGSETGIGYVLATAAPFMFSWLVAAPLVGAYRTDVAAQTAASIGRALLAWALALFPGVAGRALLRQSAFPPISFAITTFLIIGVLLVGWRALFALLQRRGAHRAN
ncbi:MAG: DUF3054 domain-containing protein [Roseiflexaceae bacterium]|nr:DUF3054 domain-containing protein [Roseiflexaceae bacterium]